MNPLLEIAIRQELAIVAAELNVDLTAAHEGMEIHLQNI
jgi:hypothetical protein